MKNKLKTIFALSSIVLALSACSSENDSGVANVDAPYQSAEIGVSIGYLNNNPVTKSIYATYVELAKNVEAKVLVEKVEDGNIDTQIAQLDNLKSKGAKALVVSPVDVTKSQMLIDRYCGSTFLIFLNRDPGAKEILSCKNAYVVSIDYAQTGILQGLQILEHWKKHPEWDKNKDGRIQYALLKGSQNHPGTNARAKWVISTIKNYPSLDVGVQSVMEEYANFNPDVAKEIVSKWVTDSNFEQVEVLIASSDVMALGAIDALKERKMKLPVFGIDGLPEAETAIKNGDLVATVVQNYELSNKVATRLATNLVAGINPMENIPYHMSNRVVVIPPTLTTASTETK